MARSSAGRAGVTPKGAETELLKIMKKSDRPRMTSSIWAKALKREDRLARKLVAKAVEALGAGVASAVNVVDVEAVILGVRLGQPYADKIAKAMLPHLFNDHRPPPVPVAALGDLAGAIGASLLSPPRRLAFSAY